MHSKASLYLLVYIGYVLHRVNDIFHHRMEGVLAAMSSVRLYVLPDTSPWTLDLFVHNTWLTCCQAAQVGSNECFIYVQYMNEPNKETPLLYTS